MTLSFHRRLFWTAALVVVVGCGGEDDWSVSRVPGGAHLSQVDFATEKIGWAVGDEDAVFATTDGGAAWKRQPPLPARPPGTPDETRTLNCVQFVDEKIGWAGGSLGALFVTTDGGETWRRQDAGVDKGILDIHFLDKAVGWAVGGYGLVLHTQNGGGSWEIQRQHDSHLWSVFFIDAQKGWACGDEGGLIVTNNGGKRWAKIKLSINADLYDIVFTGRQEGMDGRQRRRAVDDNERRLHMERVENACVRLLALHRV